jgi:hypothetical protein
MTAVQFELSFQSDSPPRPSPPSPPDLAARLRASGVAPTRRITLHRNRRVMISMTRDGALRVHAGYGWAPDPVIAALVAWVTPRTPARVRRAAARIFLAFPVHDYVAPPPPRRSRTDPPLPGDDARLARLTALHQELNRRWFDGQLRPIRLQLSSRMRTKLGHYTLAADGPATISISRRHLRRDGWIEVASTLLHEMVHQWQAETGRPVDHGREFRRKALEVGIRRN